MANYIQTLPQISYPILPANLDATTRRALADLFTALAAYSEQINNILSALASSDIAANRPAQGKPNRFFYATDTNHLYFDNGTAWITVV